MCYLIYSFDLTDPEPVLKVSWNIHCVSFSLNYDANDSWSKLEQILRQKMLLILFEKSDHMVAGRVQHLYVQVCVELRCRSNINIPVFTHKCTMQTKQSVIEFGLRCCWIMFYCQPTCARWFHLRDLEDFACRRGFDFYSHVLRLFSCICRK